MTSSSSKMEPAEEYGVLFRNNAWLEHFRDPRDPPNMTPRVPREYILEYFTLSPFYKEGSVYEHPQMDSESLKHMRGRQYTLRQSTEDLEKEQVFIIEEKYRYAEDVAHIVRLYYYLQGTIYANPPLYHILSSRVRQVVKRVREAARMVHDDREFTPSDGHSWSHENETVEETSNKGAKIEQLKSASSATIEWSFRDTLDDIRKARKLQE